MEGNVMEDLQTRTKRLAVRVIHFYCTLPKTTEAQVLGRQVLRSGTSIGAHYREAKRARSDAEFVSKLNGGLQELDETAYWLELFIEANLIPNVRLQPLLNEVNEVTAIFVTVIRKAGGQKKHR